ncbi:MAG: DUF3168 domain-containing protein [Devosia sp.]|uniref:DUF3168 domain-containing protein n=1 Tax=Devosia sp. TaxID=1871048 RepID=UPI001A5B0EAD|nr:DUF3168 domain-containing protein [Devosia sp.]MBL8596325.1 DUF3168 domain-containing protein [Devosia sp.]
MTHPIVQLQAALVAALRAELAAPVFDAPPRDSTPPYIVIVHHDALARDGDAAPGHEHRLVLHAWAGNASRKAVLAIAEAVVEIALGVTSPDLAITLRRHDRTDSAIDQATGRARATIALTYFTEPN